MIRRKKRKHCGQASCLWRGLRRTRSGALDFAARCGGVRGYMSTGSDEFPRPSSAVAWQMIRSGVAKSYDYAESPARTIEGHRDAEFVQAPRTHFLTLSLVSPGHG